MANNFPFDFTNLKATSDFFYSESVKLNDAVEEFVQSKTEVPGLTPKQLSKLYAGLLNLVDDLFNCSGLFDDLHKIQTAALERKAR
ncbi:MAG: hypothetical protein ACYC10_20250 [Allorhizobium sp.]